MNFGDLYQRYAQNVFRFALYLSGNRARAEDIVSETFMRALLAKEEIRDQTVRAYLLRIARNLYLNEVRKSARQAGPDQALFDPAPGQEDALASQRELQVVLAELQRLPELDRAAVLLRAQGGMDDKEIASILDLAFGRIISDTSWDVSPRLFIIQALIAAGFWIAYLVKLNRQRSRFLR